MGNGVTGISSIHYMTPQERVMAVLNHEKRDKIPFTVYETKVTFCSAERELRNRGMCLIKRTSSYNINYPNVKIKTFGYKNKDGKNLLETIYETPVGTLKSLEEPVGFTTWRHERLFKNPEDYKPLLFLLEDAAITPNYDQIAHSISKLGSDIAVRDTIPLEPLQALISNYMGVEEFAYQWMDNRDEIMKLYNAILDTNRKTYELVAKGPLKFANYGGNVTPSIIGNKVFRELYVPHYNECADIMHKHNKLLGVHFDGENSTILQDIADTDLDYIEAYDLGMNPTPSFSETQKILGDKILWLNWPSAWHLNDPETVRDLTVSMLEQADNTDNLIIGITEDVPPDRWQDNFTAIMDGIDLFESIQKI